MPWGDQLARQWRLLQFLGRPRGPVAGGRGCRQSTRPMSAIGRNDPCPCGSGKKYKRCCLGKDATAPDAWTAVERDSVLASLMRFARRAEFDGDRAAAEVTFWGRRLEKLTAAEAREAMDFEQSRFGFHEWFVFDCPLRGGGTVVEHFLAREGGGLRSGERRYLERMRLSHLRPYEIQAVRLDEGFELLDLWANKRVRVRERLATRQLVQWDVLAARVILGPDGEPILDGSPYLYPAREKELILRVLRRLSRSLRGKLPRRDEATFFKNIGMAFHDLWLELVARRWRRRSRITPSWSARTTAATPGSPIAPTRPASALASACSCSRRGASCWRPCHASAPSAGARCSKGQPAPRSRTGPRATRAFSGRSSAVPLGGRGPTTKYRRRPPPRSYRPSTRATTGAGLTRRCPPSPAARRARP